MLLPLAPTKKSALPTDCAGIDAFTADVLYAKAPLVASKTRRRLPFDAGGNISAPPGVT